MTGDKGKGKGKGKDNSKHKSSDSGKSKERGRLEWWSTPSRAPRPLLTLLKMETQNARIVELGWVSRKS